MNQAQIQESIPLKNLTSIKTGGNARFYIALTDESDLPLLLDITKEKNIPLHVLGGGSNTLFSDKGYHGLIVHMQTKGIHIIEETEDTILLESKAGESWDDFVAYTVEHGYAGIESLSGIPGSVGATPVQNVGAYGQEIADTLDSVTVLSRKTGIIQTFTREECHFAYRYSRFKGPDLNKFIILSVRFLLKKKTPPEINHPQLQRALESILPLPSDVKKSLQIVRENIIRIRSQKSMVINAKDENTRSCGSFFTNPILSSKEFKDVQQSIAEELQIAAEEIPTYPLENGVKLPAAWILEKAGFEKGYLFKDGAVGISQNHTLALVNHHGTTQDILDFQVFIQKTVQEKFHITLEREPLFIE